MTSPFERGRVVAIDPGKDEAGVRVRVMDIAPELAQEFLNALAPYQRTLNTRHVAQLEADMRAGRWMPNGSPIRFDVYGRLCDGQHRLTACVLSGITLKQCVVVYQLSVEANATIDTTARPRNAIEVAKTRNRFAVIPSHSTLAAVAFERYDFERGRMNQTCTSIERAQLWEELPEQHQQIVHDLNQAARKGNVSNRGSLAAALRCVKANAAAGEFFALAFSNAQEAAPMGRVLFNTLTRTHGRTGYERDNAWSAMRAFVAHLRGEHMQILRPPMEWPIEERTLQALSRIPARTKP